MVEKVESANVSGQCLHACLMLVLYWQGARKEENVQNVKTGCVVQMSTDLPIMLVGCHWLVCFMCLWHFILICFLYIDGYYNKL